MLAAIWIQAKLQYKAHATHRGSSILCSQILVRWLEVFGDAMSQSLLAILEYHEKDIHPMY